MRCRSAVGLYGLLWALWMTPTPALAQFEPRPIDQSAPAETYVVEGSAGFWSPGAQMSISSESLGIAGSMIDFKKDLGLTDHRIGELRFTLRPGRKHKLRFQYIPINFTQSAVAQRDIVFNGQLYRIGVPVSSVLDWKAYRFGYEYDFVVFKQGFAGFVVDFKYTDVNASLATPIFEEYAHAAAPIPALGGIFRAYVVPTVSITGEVTGFKLPENVVEGASASYWDVDFYGTVNFTRNIGAQVGYRSFDVGYVFKRDFGDFRLRGLYFGVVARY